MSLRRRRSLQNSKLILDMVEYWQDLRPAGGLPKRSQIDPRRIEGALPYAFVLERIAPSVARFRVAGGHLSDLLGMEVRGMPLTAFFTPATRRHLGPLIEGVFSGPRALEMSLSANREGEDPMTATLLMLPLLDDAGAVTRALGCLVSAPQRLAPPYKFQIDETRETLLPMATPFERKRAAPPPKRALGMAEPQGTFVAKQPAQTSDDTGQATKVPYLKIIK